MIRLHLLGFTPDLKGLVFSGRRGGRSGTYWVPVDKAFVEALRQLEEAREENAASSGTSKGRSAKTRTKEAQAGRIPADALELGAARTLAVTDTQDLPLPSASRRSESKLSPREVQQLLREGKSVREVAKLAEVEPSWVERFMGPVLEEKAGVIRMTQDAYQSRQRLGPSGLPIGTAVLHNLQSRRATADTLDELEDGWEARRTKTRHWRVRLAFRHRGKRRVAEWEFRKDTGTVRPRNKLATELGWWPADQSRGGRAGSAPAPEEDAGEGDGSGLRRARGAAKAAKRSSATSGEAKERTRRGGKPKRGRGTTSRASGTASRRGTKAKSRGGAKAKATRAGKAKPGGTKATSGGGAKAKAKPGGTKAKSGRGGKATAKGKSRGTGSGGRRSKSSGGRSSKAAGSRTKGATTGGAGRKASTSTPSRTSSRTRTSTSKRTTKSSSERSTQRAGKTSPKGATTRRKTTSAGRPRSSGTSSGKSAKPTRPSSSTRSTRKTSRESRGGGSRSGGGSAERGRKDQRER